MLRLKRRPVYVAATAVLLTLLVWSYFVSSGPSVESEIEGRRPSPLNLYSYASDYKGPRSVPDGNTWGLAFSRKGSQPTVDFLSVPLDESDGDPTCHFLMPADSMPLPDGSGKGWSVQKYPESSVWIYDRACTHRASPALESDTFTVPPYVFQRLGVGKAKLEFTFLRVPDLLSVLPDGEKIGEGRDWGNGDKQTQYSLQYDGEVIDAKLPSEDISLAESTSLVRAQYGNNIGTVIAYVSRPGVGQALTIGQILGGILLGVFVDRLIPNLDASHGALGSSSNRDGGEKAGRPQPAGPARSPVKTGSVPSKVQNRQRQRRRGNRGRGR